ncbi:hypothetical protein B0H12DRAFT_617626 [Mycena haematopus]|nr:hypothetical protein B0H12DRAFT_617626 [Mycena haematopus]
MTSVSHIRYELEAQYWLHCEYYPRAFEVTPEIIDELRDIVIHAFGDILTSASSTVSWKINEIERMLTLIDSMSKNLGKHTFKRLEGFGCLVVRGRVYNFHGQPGVRLNMDQSVHSTVQKRTMFIKMLNLLLFYAPDFQLSVLHKTNIDRLIHPRMWPTFLTGRKSEWQEFILYATVVLNANVAFLAIQSGVDNDGNILYNRSPAQTASYVSTLMSIGSIVLGLLLVNNYRGRDHASQRLLPQRHQQFSSSTWTRGWALRLSLCCTLCPMRCSSGR